MGVKENSVKLYITLYTCFTVFLSNTPGKCSPGRQAIIDLHVRGIISYVKG